ncbi:type II toxin-antitoxin system HipA family toxin [Pedobacter gandavensis]|uniref:Type II toxin-antitoxin system HipA family toxin n=1 Tax=Pedobacter gandavensis TaxID=2679963 RepID=A0ABR6F0T7_9SPHI|nr:HipA domain-containing protein [Pedobacter gandavensis]MBB2150298.1 type II toxin-antitoxin system HipA family toxin [Pedobacter gandavensis]
MATDKTDIWVYAHWQGMKSPECIGVLSGHQSKGRKVFSFDYDKEWLKSKTRFLLDPDIQWYHGSQFPGGKENFGVFMDSMPDTWGRRLMQRRAAQNALAQGTVVSTLYELDFLLGVHDFTRMGALRFKKDPDGLFLDDNNENPAPLMAHIRALQESARLYEEDVDGKQSDKWMQMLIAPGSSLGGARPKANILDADGNLFIAKFPSKSDTTDKAAWEYLAYTLGCDAGLDMPECQLVKVHGPYRTFLSKRFDRVGGERVHFASAMTMTGNNEELIRDSIPSYLDIAEFIQYSGTAHLEKDLHQLWRRIVFNMAISNTDDHLRNHGFLLDQDGWRLSPAYDINPSTEKDGLAINVDSHHNSLDFELARSVGMYFQLKDEQMDKILQEVILVVRTWRSVANKIGISKVEQELMSPAFSLTI